MTYSSDLGHTPQFSLQGVTPQVEREFLRTLSLVRSRDPAIYQENTTFYSAQGRHLDWLLTPVCLPLYLSLLPSHIQAPSVKQQIKKPQQPMFLKDYERKRLLERGRLETSFSCTLGTLLSFA